MKNAVPNRASPADEPTTPWGRVLGSGSTELNLLNFLKNILKSLNFGGGSRFCAGPAVVLLDILIYMVLDKHFQILILVVWLFLLVEY